MPESGLSIFGILLRVTACCRPRFILTTDESHLCFSPSPFHLASGLSVIHLPLHFYLGLADVRSSLSIPDVQHPPSAWSTSNITLGLIDVRPPVLPLSPGLADVRSSLSIPDVQHPPSALLTFDVPPPASNSPQASSLRAHAYTQVVLLTLHIPLSFGACLWLRLCSVLDGSLILLTSH
ncbi:hypothetical protein F4780DRAFT_19545 [Xylariomycetidae sp. FL0641]|nr:hypothetical protein F4780DRAFT_19545 [Xylariomycetidae sp. FL0641]